MKERVLLPIRQYIVDLNKVSEIGMHNKLSYGVLITHINFKEEFNDARKLNM